jgi:hypothetical protein
MSTGAQPLPQPAKQASATSASGTTPIPKAGRWKDTPKVSFNLSKDGRVRNFTISATIEEPLAQLCTIEASADIPVSTSGTFTLTSWAVVDEATESCWTLSAFLRPELTQIRTNRGNLYRMLSIQGQFDSATSLAGTYSFSRCEEGKVFARPTKGDF